MIQGMTVTLYEKTLSGYDAFNVPTYTLTPVQVNNVLVGEPTAEERTDEFTLTGKMIAYTLGIPKGDTHEWKDTIVEFFGEKFRTFGIPVMGIEANIPLCWHKKVKCERYEV